MGVLGRSWSSSMDSRHVVRSELNVGREMDIIKKLDTCHSQNISRGFRCFELGFFTDGSSI